MTDLIRKLREGDDYESSWKPRQMGGAGRAKLVPPSTPSMNSPGNKGGVMRDGSAAARRNQLDVQGRPRRSQVMRLNSDGMIEVYDPQEAYDKRKNDT